MRKLLGGKNILLILFIISLFSSFFVTNSSNSAFADDKDKRVKLDEENNCKNYGGEFKYVPVGRIGDVSRPMCIFRKDDGNEIHYTYNTDIPDTFYTYSKDHKCPNGYKEEPFTAGNTTTAKCTKSATNSNGANDPSTTGKTEDDKDEGKSNCKVDHFGWIVCPGAKAMGSMVSGLYKSIADNFLSVKSGQIFQGDSGAKAAWQSFRDIGNVIFIIAIMAIVISQITGYGISNYGIKKCSLKY